MYNKSAYVKPELQNHGSIEKITEAVGWGNPLDQNFSNGDPVTNKPIQLS